MTRSHEPIAPAEVVRAAVDVLVYAPIGLGVMLVEDTPAAVGRARQELSNARFIGRLAVDQGLTQLRKRFEPALEDVSSNDRVNDTATESVTVDQPAHSDDVPHPVAVAAADLALPDYDTLPAIDIVAKLETLTPMQRAEIGAYETVHRRRRTVLGKLDQLAAS